MLTYLVLFPYHHIEVQTKWFISWRQNFQMHFLDLVWNENHLYISLNFVSVKGWLITFMSPLVLLTAWHCAGYKPLPKPMLTIISESLQYHNKPTHFNKISFKTKPKSFTKMLTSILLFTPRWYHGRLDRNTAEDRLRQAGQPGSYLIRESDRKPGSYVLSFLGKTGINHFR